jgi:hypothetical protein
VLFIPTTVFSSAVSFLALLKVWTIGTSQPSSDLIDNFFLGGLFPGITLLLSNFYKRHAMQLRFAMMFSVSSLAGAFSGLLAYGIRNLNGKHGIAGWQWIFIVVRRLSLSPGRLF